MRLTVHSSDQNEYTMHILDYCFELVIGSYMYAASDNEILILLQGYIRVYQEVPFRQWYGELVEFKCLLSSSSKFAIFTATATDTTKTKISGLLQISPLSTYCIEKDPIRKNICHVFQHIEKDKSLEDIMMPIIRKIRMMKVATPRTIILSQARKQCALLYRLFSLSLGEALYSNEQLAPESRYVEMFACWNPKVCKIPCHPADG